MKASAKKIASIVAMSGFGFITLAGCGASTAQSAAAAPLSVVDAPQGSWSENFNPFSPNALFGTVGYIYEPLMQFIMISGKALPWLAQSYQWSDKNAVLTIHLAPHVKWSNGNAFTSQDVLYTFNLLKKFPALDTNDVWQTLKSVTAPNATTVVFTLDSSDRSAFYYLMSVTPVDPAVWQSVKNPVTFTNAHPVATGPYTLKSFGAQDYVMTRNMHYWKGTPTVPELSFPAYTSNSSVDLALSKGDVNWAGLFSPDIQSTYVAKDPAVNHYWFAQAAPVMLFTNDAQYPFNSTVVRRALSYAINRQAVSSDGEYGYEKPASALGIPPGESRYIDAQAEAQAPSQYDPQKALRLLESAGFHKDAAGTMMMPNGKPFAFSLLVVAAYSDWVQDVTIISQELKQLGITVNVKALQYAAYYSDLQSGKFSTAIGWSFSGPSPFYFYNYAMNAGLSAPIGQTAATNFQRFTSPTATRLLDAYNASSSAAQRKTLLDQIQIYWAHELPSIPLVWGAYWNEYSTKTYTGWPSAKNPYDDPGPNDASSELTILNLKPVH
jgi:peptide/nickel transport system substrate-binding protein